MKDKYHLISLCINLYIWFLRTPFLSPQVYEPIRAMIIGAPLEDARFLTYRYDRIRQDVEAQVNSTIMYLSMEVKKM